MAIEFAIPNVGDNVNSVTIVDWLVEDGSQVNADQEIIEVETDKATVTIPVEVGGVIHFGPYKAGDAVNVGTVVAIIGTADETFSSYTVADTSANVPATASESNLPATPSAEEPSTPSTSTSGGQKVTPVARKMAVELGVDLQTVTGSGNHGRVTKADVLQATGQTPAVATPVSTPPVKPASPKPASSVSISSADVIETVPLKGIRQIIATRMAESVHTTARVTLVREVDATGLVAFREQLKEQVKDAWGFTPGYNELLTLICGNALREFPFMNARLSADGQSIEYLASVNIGMAVDTPRGLLVGVQKNIQEKGLQQIGAQFRALVERVRTGKAAPDELTGGTFTISNLGMLNIDAFTPVINLPELAILGVGRIVPKPVVKEDEIVIRKMWTLSLVFDHRLVDGAPAARFLNHICELIEEPELIFLTKR
ncbi:dihydrolipoamide acetyltransferase family protein [Anaerolineales bacterium HSG6]|nr:dihydrolipoamide acetyltransferase family protein [Anaerolineales bacterium HSG6]